MNGDRFLVDTNVLVYAYDRSEPAKQLRSRQILNWLLTARAGVLTTQVLAGDSGSNGLSPRHAHHGSGNWQADRIAEQGIDVQRSEYAERG